MIGLLEPQALPVISLYYELFMFDDGSGQPVFGRGRIDDSEELGAIQESLVTVQLVPASIAAKPLGRVIVALSDGSEVIVEPVFHAALDKYGDLCKTGNYDFKMPEDFENLLNHWRRRLLEE